MNDPFAPNGTHLQMWEVLIKMVALNDIQHPEQNISGDSARTS